MSVSCAVVERERSGGIVNANTSVQHTSYTEREHRGCLSLFTATLFSYFVVADIVYVLCFLRYMVP